MDNKPKKILDDILEAQDEYSKIYRRAMSQPRYETALEQKVVKDGDYFNELVLESVLEHIGHLPMLATVIHPHLENRDKVDLAKSLLYLSLHEAPERITGDKFRLHKTEADEDEELEAAKKIFSGEYQHYLELYEDFHFARNINAQFALSVDKIAPFIYFEITSPEIRIKRWEQLGGTIENNRNKNEKYMKWDKTMEDFFDYVLESIKQQDEEYLKNN